MLIRGHPRRHRVARNKEGNRTGRYSGGLLNSDDTRSPRFLLCFRRLGSQNGGLRDFWNLDRGPPYLLAVSRSARLRDRDPNAQPDKLRRRLRSTPERPAFQFRPVRVALILRRRQRHSRETQPFCVRDRVRFARSQPIRVQIAITQTIPERREVCLRDRDHRVRRRIRPSGSTT